MESRNSKKEYKQVIVMRTDLGMRKGKMVAQGAHASVGVLQKYLLGHYPKRKNFIGKLRILSIYIFPESIRNWLIGPFTKICVGASHEGVVRGVALLAQLQGIPYCVITDSGKTEFKGVPTVTCCAIGPDTIERVDEITGKLKLL